MQYDSDSLQVFHFPQEKRGLGLRITDHDALFNAEKGMPQSMLPHRHSFFELLYYTGGKGTHCIDFTPYLFTPPSVFFIAPGQVHYWKVEEPLKGKLILFTEDFLVLNPSPARATLEDVHLFYHVMQQPVVNLEGHQHKFIDHLVSGLEEEFTACQWGRTTMLRASLHILLIHLFRMYRQAEGSPHALASENVTLVLRFKRLISGNPVMDLPLDFYAGKLGTSTAHLSASVKKLTGSSPGKLVQQEVALEAKRLLVHTDMTAAQIGYTLNFDDPSYFGRFFKRETGRSPRQFRTETREKYQLFLG